MNKIEFFEQKHLPTTTAQRLSGNNSASHNPLAETPLICRLIKAYYKENRACYEAYFFHGDISFRVNWTASQCDPRLKPNTLVVIHGLSQHPDKPHVFRASQVEVLKQPVPELNLFHTVPTDWVNDRDLIRRAVWLIEALPSEYRHFFNAVMWDQNRFLRYCVWPSSKVNHHNYMNGNLIHSVDVAHNVFQACLSRPTASPALGILAALLHDAGKADEYIPVGNGKFKLSPQGTLLGHKNTVTQWISQAKVLWNIPLRENDYMALQHCLNSAPNAPPWTEIRQPLMEEAFILSSFDRMSGQLDLLQRNAPEALVGWGDYNEYFKGRLFRIERYPAYDPAYAKQACRLSAPQAGH